MAGYDGSIRINTEILVKSAEKQLRVLENSMDKTATKAASLRDKMEAMRSTKIPTQEYAALGKELSNLGAQYDRIAERQQKFLESGGKENSRTYKGMEHDLDMISEKQNTIISQMKEIENAGKAFTLGSSTEEYAKTGQQLKYLEASLETMNQQHEIAEDRLNAALQRREAERKKLNQIAAEEERLAQIRENATVEDQEIIGLLERRRELMQEIADLEKAGVGEGYQEYYDAQGELSDINGQIEVIREARNEQEEMRSSYARLPDAARNAFSIMAQGLKNIPLAAIRAGINSIIAGFKRMGSVVQSSAVAPFKLLGATAKEALSGIGKSSKGTNNIFQKGFKNLAQVSEPVNASLSSLKSSLTQLKNSLATAFAPILTTITPLLTSFINMISKAATYVGMFTAALTGKGSFVKAVAVQEDYAASLEKTGGAAKKAVKALAGFDKLNVLGQTESDGGGAGAAETPVTDMFEEVEMPDKFKEMAQWIKDMWAESDFTELGRYLGEKLKEALDSIPWDEIKEKAGNLGKSLATLINGFIEVDGLGYSIGRTLAETFNTGFEFLNSFVHELHWESLGKFIAEILNGIFENIDWELIHDTFVTGARGLGDAINSFADNLNWDAVATTVSNFVNTFVDTIYTFITTVDWSELGTKIGTAISDAWTGIDWAKVGETLGEYFKAFFDFVGKAIEAVDWQAVGESVKDFLIGIDWAGVADSFFEAVGAALGGFAAFIGGADCRRD
jgi:chorismate mutase/predicted PurR-regulated permease PerM